MAKIIGIHGVGHQFSGRNTLIAEWLPSLKDGLERAGGKLDPASFDCAFYGDLFRPSGKAALDPPYDASDITEKWELELLEELRMELNHVQPIVSTGNGKTKISLPNVVQSALDALSQSTFFSGLAERALIYDLKQLSLYIKNAEIRMAAQRRIEDALSPDSRILVAHSLGTVVAYEALCRNSHWPVHTLITLGSPLGVRNLVFDRLNPAPKNGVGQWPVSIKNWINIADSGDLVALRKDLQPQFGPRVNNYLVHNGARSHDATRYLTTQEFGNALANVL